MMWAIVKYQRVGFHCWPDAPDKVAFLRNEHRHVFHFEVWIEQRHDDRDIEYFMFQNYLRKQVDKMFVLLPIFRSCEMMAQWLKDRIQKDYLDRCVKVMVTEDNECGAMADDTETPYDY